MTNLETSGEMSEKEKTKALLANLSNSDGQPAFISRQINNINALSLEVPWDRAAGRALAQKQTVPDSLPKPDNEFAWKVRGCVGNRNTAARSTPNRSAQS